MTEPGHSRAAQDRKWMSQAACRDKDPRWFTDPNTAHDIRQALATCATCRVRAACLATALRQPPEADLGIWGGTTEQGRQRIRTGHLTIEQALATDPRAEPQPHPQANNETVANQRPRPAAVNLRPIRKLPAPEITVARDPNGDYVSADGRVIIFRIHGEPPWMLMIDRRCIARTPTLTEARRVAWTTLHNGHQAAITQPDKAQLQPPASRARRR